MLLPHHGIGRKPIARRTRRQPDAHPHRQPREALGRSAVAFLLRAIDGVEIPEDERELRLEAELRIGGSTGPAPHSPGRGGSRTAGPQDADPDPAAAMIRAAGTPPV